MSGKHDSNLPDVTVDGGATEATIHAAIGQALQKVSDEHGVQIENVRASWIDFSNSTEDHWFMRKISVDSFSTRRK